MNGLGEIGRLRAEVTALAAELTRAVHLAREQGASWDSIAAMLTVSHAAGHGYRLALGDLFPGGVSATTVRKIYGRDA